MGAPALRSGVVAQVALKALTPDPNNPRTVFDENAIAALADSIKARGVLQPLIVRKGEKGAIVVQDGHRRLRAAKAAKLKTVPVLLAEEADAASVRLDQVAANQLHEKLAPMDLARTLRRLRDEQKLTPNDLAARMAKAGQPMTLKEIEASIALTDLPAWAAAMIDAGELKQNAAKPVAFALKDPAVAKTLEKEFKQQVGWEGDVDADRASEIVEDAYDNAGKVLSNEYTRDPAHFDWKKRCKGCEHLRVPPGSRGAYCMDAKLYAAHNTEAKSAGLGPLGKVTAKAAAAAPDKLTPKQLKKLEAEREERREKVAATRGQNYLDQWLRTQCATRLVKRPDVVGSVVVWLAAARPDAGLIGNSFIPQSWKGERELRGGTGRPGRFDEYLKGEFRESELLGLAVAGLTMMTPGQIRDLAAKLGVSMAVDFRADAEYLKLRSVEQLRAWLELYGLDIKGTAGAMRQRLLDHPHTLEWSPKLPHMVALQDAYAAPVRDEERAKDEIEADDLGIDRDELDEDAAIEETKAIGPGGYESDDEED